MKKYTLETSVGSLQIIVKEEFLVYCNWDESECLPKERGIEEKITPTEATDKEKEIIEETLKQLSEYFEGRRKEFSLPLKFIGTDFQKKVWQSMLDVPYGSTVSYKQLAEKCGHPKAFRAVANACGANPISIITPCHRVCSSHGKIGGYTGGIDKKRWLLSIEGIKI